MAKSNDSKVRVRIFVEERSHGTVWVPYKTLIGYTMRNRPIIGRLWEQEYCVDEFGSKVEAVGEAKRRARSRIMELLGHTDVADTEWDVIHERGPDRIAVTYEETLPARQEAVVGA
ncbi:hypothetical protein [Candidatus Nitrospira bockiana]